MDEALGTVVKVAASIGSQRPWSRQSPDGCMGNASEAVREKNLGGCGSSDLDVKPRPEPGSHCKDGADQTGRASCRRKGPGEAG